MGGLAGGWLCLVPFLPFLFSAERLFANTSPADFICTQTVQKIYENWVIQAKNEAVRILVCCYYDHHYYYCFLKIILTIIIVVFVLFAVIVLVIVIVIVVVVVVVVVCGLYGFCFNLNSTHLTGQSCRLRHWH